MSRLRAQVHLHRVVGRSTHFGGEHQVKLAHVGPVPGSADGAYDFLVQDNLLQFVEIHLVHRCCVALVQRVALLLVLNHAGVGLAEFLLVESLAEAFLGLVNLFLYLFLVFSNLVFNQHIGTIALFRVAVVNQRVVESVHVSAGLPYRRVHEDGRVDAHDVLVEQHHALPPILLDVVLQLHAVLTIVVNGS